MQEVKEKSKESHLATFLLLMIRGSSFSGATIRFNETLEIICRGGGGGGGSGSGSGGELRS